MDFLKQYGPTIFFMTGMIVWFFAKWKPHFKSEVDREPFGEYPQPKIAQTWGVLGTFIGITIGLLGFGLNSDPENMHKGVMSLLGGMTTAFFTSVTGMGMYLWLNNYQDNAKSKAKEEKGNLVDQDATIGDLIQYMMKEDAQRRSENHDMLEVLQKSNHVLGETISNAISEMQHSVVGDGEYTVIGQMKQIRLETHDEISKLRDEARQANQELIIEFREFAKTMAENNTKAFIEALNETMKDFNTKLTEQFGENFKQLNEAVGRLLDWQIQYRNTVEEVTNTQREIFDGIEGVRESMKSMEASSSGMTESASKMADLIVTANTFNEKLERALTDLMKISGEAQNVVPNIVALFNTSSNEIADYTKSSINNIQDSTSKANESIQSITSKGIEDATVYFQKLDETISATTEKIEEYTRNTIDKIRESTDAMLDSLYESCKNTRENLYDLTNYGIEKSNRYYDNWIKIHTKTNDDLHLLYTTIANDMGELNTSLKANSQLITDNSDKALESLTQYTQNTINHIEDVSNALREASRKAQDDFAAQSTATHESVKKAADALQNKALNITRDISDQLNEMMKTNNENLKKSSENLSKDLDNKIKSSLETMGNAMGSISQKFANDYRPIADRLAEIVELANARNRKRG